MSDGCARSESRGDEDLGVRGIFGTGPYSVQFDVFRMGPYSGPIDVAARTDGVDERDVVSALSFVIERLDV